MDNLSDLIREAREAKLLTQKELAEAIGVAPETISTWERGANTPRKPILRKVFAYLEIPLKNLEQKKGTAHE
ncbi:helix-turn-helix transcriptional regulator [Deinococcus misasensis]|uniref:helix-turn-helix transcriptional regulator n=1 Tax=Deinococcus misasensis TaxID=392413 RepID=UPI0005536E81|nr:helix-turn-helix transcriptional regulator [Deinococcus misasensis]